MSFRCRMAGTIRVSKHISCSIHRFILLVTTAIMLLVAMVITAILPTNALADQVSHNEPLSLTVEASCNCQLSEQDQVNIWLVAKATEGNSLIPIDSFADASDNWGIGSSGSARLLSDSLSTFVVKSSIAPTATSQFGPEGTAVFSEEAALKPGYYLIVGDSHKSGGVWHQALPSLVAIPSALEDGSQDCAPVVTMKYAEEPSEDDQTPTVTPVPDFDEKLPQTGQLWWPVVVLLAVGVVLLAVGVSKAFRR